MNPPPNTAPKIDDQYSQAAMPASGTATGGTIESGTYYMTAITNYESASSGGTHQDTLVFDTGASTFVVDEVNGGKTKPTVAGTFTVTGANLKQDLVCPAMVTATVEFTYDAGTLTIYEYGSKTVSTWTKQ